MVGFAQSIEPDERLANPLFASVVLHAVLFAALGGLAWWRGSAIRIGDPNTLGGVTVVATDGIPMVQRTGPRNPVANDTESQVPERPKPATKQRVEPEDPDAVAIDRLPKKKKKLTPFEEKILAQQRKLAERDLKENQVYSTTGRALVAPTFAATSSGSGGSIGSGNPFGEKFGAYGKLVIDRIAQKWRTQDIDPGIQTAPMIVVNFDILRDGHVKNVKLLQRSGVYQLDLSAQRAVLEAGPFEPLPAGFDSNVANVQINFQFKR